MKTAKAAKGDRRAHRKAKDRRRRDAGSPIRASGEGLLDASVLEQVLAAVRLADVAAPWPDVAPRILPVLKRVHHPYPPEAAPLHIQVPPGIWTGFGIDLGPAFSHVSGRMMANWGVDEATLLGTALENLRGQVQREPPVIQRFSRDGTELMAVMGAGWGSSLLLLPEVLAPIIGPEPRTLLAPVRNTLVVLPEDAEAELAVEVWLTLAEDAPDELDVDPLRWSGSSVVRFGDRIRGLPN